MNRTYQQVYPSAPKLDSSTLVPARLSELLTLEYFEAEPGSMPEQVFDQHHILLNLRETPHRVENWRNGEYRDFQFHQHEIVVTPAGTRSGWRWHARSKVIVITLMPDALERVALNELNTVLTSTQLKDIPQFVDADLCAAATMLRDALAMGEAGSDVMFESLARVFLVKLIGRYAEPAAQADFGPNYTAEQHKRVLLLIGDQYSDRLPVAALAREAGLSEAHFSRQFKRVIGGSPGRFLTRYRIEQARQLLQDQARQIGQVALDCGFYDQAHFSRSFKQLTGQTPRQFRATLAL